MQKKRLGWILLPVVIILIAVVTLVMSSYQKEAGIIDPGKGGTVTVAALAEAQAAATGSGEAAYDAFGKTLTVAMSEVNNMAITNPAETRLQLIVGNAVDAMRAQREAWAAQLSGDWDPAVDGSAAYWWALHPGMQVESRPAPQQTGLTVTQVREWAASTTDYWVKKALDLVE